ncbi:MAG: MBL fold metallo-hydrolase [Hydrogenophaga sp.]|jgi:glyoxylase-like metal-dependent hydrolase (beta-lactamase superfamily II)|nr:MBL fold metallo-hydrolase [Hydrogenophaga sp.]
MHTTDPDRQRLDAAGITFLQRGWLSSNNILVRGDGPTTLVDSGYWTHSAQTLALVEQATAGQAIERLLNTHLHSDHCGGNAALQEAYPGLVTMIPPGLANAVSNWDPVALTFEPTGQHCPRFGVQGLLTPGSTVRMGSHEWEVHGAKGHDPHSIILYEPLQRVLISADALWENGFGVVFPELEGVSAFDEVAQTLDAIEVLNPALVLPGHGSAFGNVSAALDKARSRLEQFVTRPDKHMRHAWKVLIKYKLLEWQSISRKGLNDWARATPYLAQAMPSGGQNPQEAAQWLDSLLEDLGRSSAIKIQGDLIVNV